jgi:hypothetical protein
MDKFASNLTQNILKELKPEFEKIVIGKMLDFTTYLVSNGINIELINQYWDAPATSMGQTFEKLDNNKVRIVIDYQRNHHALFGDFESGIGKDFKDEVINTTVWIKGSNYLRYGEGWLIPKSRLDDLKALLDKRNIFYEEKNNSDYDEEFKQDKRDLPEEEDPNKEVILLPPEEDNFIYSDSEDSSSEKELNEPLQPITNKKFNIPTTTINEWNNKEEGETGFVFEKIPIGPGGKGLWVALGYQDGKPLDGKTGLDTVLPLDKSRKKICNKKKWRYLTKARITKVKNHDKKLGTQLQKILNRK